MEAISSKLSHLNVKDGKTTKEAQYIDITQEFFKINETIEFHDLVKSQHFKLIEGTHALEVSNARLDSHLIKYESYGCFNTDSSQKTEISKGANEGQFDVSKERTSHEIEWVFQGLFKLIDSWFEFNTSLSCNLLSCEYISSLLREYKTDKTSLKNGNWGANGELKSLRMGCIGLIQFMKYMIKLGQMGVIYEEEDLNTQTMNFDMLMDVEIHETIQDLEHVISGIGENRIKGYLQLIVGLLDIFKILDIDIDVYQPLEYEKKAKPLVDRIDKVLKVVEFLKEKEIKEDSINFDEMKHCFNNKIQKYEDNSSPPKRSVLSNSEEGKSGEKSWFFVSLDNLTFLFNDLKYMLVNLIQCPNTLDLIEFLTKFMNFRKPNITEIDEIIGHHVITRCVLQLFILRDNKSIMGSQTLFTQDLLIEYIKSTSGIGSRLFELLEIDNYKLSNRAFDASPELKDAVISLKFKLQFILNNLESPFLNLISTISQNSSRQRQFKIKELVIWDTLHVEIKNFEMELLNLAKFPDSQFSYLIDELPVLSMFVYFQKMRTIESVVFKTIELKVSKDIRELHIDYWYLRNYVFPVIIDECINDQFLKLIEHRTNRLSAMNKKYKKCKAGEKKQKLKEEYMLMQQLSQPSLTNFTGWMSKNLKSYLVKQEIIKLQLGLIELIYGLNKDLFNIPRYCKTSEELLFYLQLKYISSIGIPNQPNYTEYQEYKSCVSSPTIEELRSGGHELLVVLKEGQGDISNTAELTGSVASILDTLESIEAHATSEDKLKSYNIQYPNKGDSYFPKIALNFA